MDNDTEHDDFEAIFRKPRFAIYSRNDFIIREVPHPKSGTAFVERTDINITRKSNGRSKTYLAGHGHAWTVTFEDALKAGGFD